MNIHCFACSRTLTPPLYCINYCNECYQSHITTYHDRLIDDALRTEQKIIQLREELDRTRDLIDEIRKEAKRCGFGIGSDVKKEFEEDRETSEHVD